jgi:chromosome segregation ATPase
VTLHEAVEQSLFSLWEKMKAGPAEGEDAGEFEETAEDLKGLWRDYSAKRAAREAARKRVQQFNELLPKAREARDEAERLEKELERATLEHKNAYDNMHIAEDQLSEFLSLRVDPLEKPSEKTARLQGQTRLEQKVKQRQDRLKELNGRLQSLRREAIQAATRSQALARQVENLRPPNSKPQPLASAVR